MFLLIFRSQFEMANSSQETGNMIHDDIKASISVSWLVTETYRLTESGAATSGSLQES